MDTSEHPVLFIGDEVTATGYRLAGARVRVASAAEAVDEVLAWGLEHCQLLLLGSDFAGRLDPSALSAAQGAPQPLVLVVPDVRGLRPLGDLTAELRTQLGMAGG